MITTHLLVILILITSITALTIVPYIIGRYIIYKEKPNCITDIFLNWISGILSYAIIFIIIISYKMIFYILTK